MDAQNYWFSSGAAGGGGNEGDPIGQSLRFRGTTDWLRKNDFATTPSSTFTFSMWVKLSRSDQLRYLYGFGNQALLYQSAGLFVYQGTGDRVQPNSTAVYRDPSAWYHICVSNTPGTYNLWINGELQGTNNRTVTPANDIRIGDWSGQSGVGSCGIYCADVYWIDGQTLQPTAFGRFNNNGVWVPVDYDGDADDYGANGFHLTFEDPDDLGADSAPIGATGHTAANDFTPNGFNTDPVGIFSGMLSAGSNASDMSGGCGTATSGDMFELSTGGTPSSVTPETCWLVFQPNPALTNITQLEVNLTGLNGQEVAINGTVEFGPNNGTTGWTNIPLPTGFTGTLNSVSIFASNGGNRAQGVRINGTTILVDNTGEDYDLMQDSPTQNYATYNPLSAVPTDFEAANLTERNSGTSAWEQGNATQVITGGRWYFEAEAIGANSFGIGFGDERWNPNQNDVFIGQQVGSIGYNGANGNVHINGTAFAYGNTYTVGDVVQVAADMDNDLIWFGINGTWQSSATQAQIEAGDGTNAAWNAFNADMYQFVTVTSDSGGNAGWAANFGQQPFVFAAPNGFEPLQTQNLPEPTILNGSDHFRALSGTGANILDIAEGTNNTGDNWNPDVNTGFENGLYIIKSRTNTEQWQYVDSINGDDGVFRTPGNTAPDDYFEPTGTAVAWCWNAPDAFNNDDIDSGFRNVAAGFSIIQYTGNGATERDIEHGLDRTPGLIINFQPVNGDVRFWINGLTGTGELTQNLVLNTGEAASNMFSSGLIHAPTGTQNVTVGLDNPSDPNRNVLAVNETGRVYTQYIWAPIPGYSAFGSFDGNSSNNGPFIYCGFKPALIWIQAADQGGGDAFFTADSTCQLSNPYGEGTLLNMASTDSEGTSSARPWDMLSNGFKIRSNSGSVNSGNVVWAAWAQNPFGGENTAPANAR